MNLSLVVVFVSILYMGGIVERLFREFSITWPRRSWCRCWFR